MICPPVAVEHNTVVPILYLYTPYRSGDFLSFLERVLVSDWIRDNARVILAQGNISQVTQLGVGSDCVPAPTTAVRPRLFRTPIDYYDQSFEFVSGQERTEKHALFSRRRTGVRVNY